MASDVMSVRLWLPRIRVVGVVVDLPERLSVRVCSTVRRPRCPDCGAPSGRVHDRRDRRVRDLEVSGRPVTLVFELNWPGRTLAAWRPQITNWHTSRATNGPTEAANNLAKRVKRVAFGFANFANFRIRALLYAGRPDWTLLQTLTPPLIREEPLMGG